MLKFLQHILQLIISPAKGWEDVASAGTLPVTLCRVGFYPLLAVTALTCVFRLFYDHLDTSMVIVLQDAIITFTVYFATLFFAQFVLSTTLGKYCDTEPSEHKVSTFVIFVLATLAIFNILENIVPVEIAIVKILPAYAIFIIYKGARYLDVKPDKIGQYMFLTVFTVLAPPYLLSFLFKLIMPNA